MITWPDLILPPINLYTMPRQDFPREYIDLEKKYCRNNTGIHLKYKREEFNRLWNSRSS